MSSLRLISAVYLIAKAIATGKFQHSPGKARTSGSVLKIQVARSLEYHSFRFGSRNGDE